MSAAEVEKNLAEGKKHVIRLKIPMEGVTVMHDKILGTIERANTDINPDPVLLKSDGFPTYHLANVIDDHYMEITHIMRSQEWVPSGPIHVIMYAAFGWTPPVYVHLPLVMGPDGGKLAKRHGATAVRDFRKNGVLPEAILNYVTLVGWSYDDSRELFSKADLETLFDIDKVSKSPAVFDYKKLEHFNGLYIRAKSDAELAALVKPYFASALIDADERKLAAVVPHIRERMKTLADAPGLCRYLFAEIESYNVDDVVPKKMDRTGTVAVLARVRGLVDAILSKDDAALEELFRVEAEKAGVKLGQFMMPLRVAVSGSTVSLPLFDSIRILGKEETLKRIDRVIALLG
jgi:glutamyl-tRNA synthetase